MLHICFVRFNSHKWKLFFCFFILIFNTYSAENKHYSCSFKTMEGENGNVKNTIFF